MSMNLCFTIRGLKERKLLLLHGYHSFEYDDTVLYTVLSTQDWQSCGWWLNMKGWNRVYISACFFSSLFLFTCILSVLYSSMQPCYIFSNFWCKDYSFIFFLENLSTLIILRLEILFHHAWMEQWQLANSGWQLKFHLSDQWELFNQNLMANSCTHVP